MSLLLDFFTDVQQFMNDGIFGWGEQTIQYIAAKYIIWTMEAKIYFIKFSYGVAQQMIEQLSFNDLIHAAWDQIPNQYLSFFSYLKIPESLNLVISAQFTRFVLDFFE